jgi:hypothetical protein
MPRLLPLVALALLLSSCSYPRRVYTVDPAECWQSAPPLPSLMICATKRTFIPPTPPLKIDWPPLPDDAYRALLRREWELEQAL